MDWIWKRQKFIAMLRPQKEQDTNPSVRGAIFPASKRVLSIFRSNPLSSDIQAFFAQVTFAVVGASRSRAKYGNRVLRMYQRLGWPVTPVNPHAAEIEGLPCAEELGGVSPLPDAISVITPPSVTTSVVREAIRLGIEHIWLQPGADSVEAIQACEEAGINVIWGGPCILVDAPGAT